MRGTFLVALTTLFVIPLAVFMGHSMEKGGMVSAWAGLLMGAIYGGCSLGVCWLLLGQWERQLADRAEQPHPVKETASIELSQLEELQLPTEPIDETFSDSGMPEAQAVLQECIQKAESLPCMGTSSERFRALNLENYAIDLRRLFDAVSHKGSSMAIVLYSEKEERLLFANVAVSKLLGWSPERFCQQFLSLLAESRSSWEEGMRKIYRYKKMNMPLMIQSKNRDMVALDSVWGVISSGSFEGIVIGVLTTPSDHTI